MLRRVVLHGRAREFFGKEFELDVSTLAEAVRAIGLRFPHFRRFIAEGHFRVVLGKSMKAGEALDKTQIGTHLAAGDIHILPVMVGGKRSNGLLKIIAGVLIAAVAWWAAPAMSAVAFGGVTYGQIAMIGIGLAASGLSQLLAKKPGKEKDDSSKTISGAINSFEQGGPVPLVYGLRRVGSTVISSGVTTADLPIES